MQGRANVLTCSARLQLHSNVAPFGRLMSMRLKAAQPRIRTLMCLKTVDSSSLIGCRHFWL